MTSTPVLVLIALTVLACAFIVALLLRIRAHRLQVTPVFGSYTRDPNRDRTFVATNPRYVDVFGHPPELFALQEDGTFKPESKAK